MYNFFPKSYKVVRQILNKLFGPEHLIKATVSYSFWLGALGNIMETLIHYGQRKSEASSFVPQCGQQERNFSVSLDENLALPSTTAEARRPVRTSMHQGLKWKSAYASREGAADKETAVQMRRKLKKSPC